MVQRGEVIITLPGTNYSVTYFKPNGSFGLLAKDMVKEDDLRLPMTAGQFLAKAWKLANEKARELGWIIWRSFSSYSLRTRGAPILTPVE